MLYKYMNLDSKQEVGINIYKKYTFIYGPNGTGKTTFSREILKNPIIQEDGINKIHLVFNQDFVNNNIYISTSDNGYKLDSKNKSRLKQIFLGDTSKEDNEKLNFLRTKAGEYNKYNIDINIFKNDFKNLVIELLKDEKEYNLEFEQFIMSYINDELLNQYVEQTNKNMDKKSFEIDLMKLENVEYMKNVAIPNIKTTYSDEQVIRELIDFLKERHYKQEQSINTRIEGLNKIVIEKLNEEFIREKLISLEEIINDLREKKDDYILFLKLQGKEEEFLKERLDTTEINIKEVSRWISEGHKYHEKIDFQECLYCKNSISEEQKKEYETIIKNTYINKFNVYKKEIDNIKSIIEEIENQYQEIKKYDWYAKAKRKKEEKFIRIIIKKFKNILDSCEEQFKNKTYYIQLINKFKSLEKYVHIIKEQLNIHEVDNNDNEDKRYKAYQLYIKSDKFIRQLKIGLIKEKIQDESKKLEEKIKKDTNEYIQKIEEYIHVFEEIYEPRIQLKLKSNLSRAYSAEAMIEIASDEKDFLNNISEGEKNVLALTIFFSYVKNKIKQLKENEEIIIILDDPVNSNDWGNFFKFQAIIEDYFYEDVNVTGKIDKIVILSHNIDYAIIQLQNDKYQKYFELKRLFSTKCENIDTDFIFMDDIKLGSKLLHDLLNGIEQSENNIYIIKNNLYRVAIYMRKFLESIITNHISIADPEKVCNNEECLQFLKENINSEIINEFIDISTCIIKETNKEIYEVNEYMHKIIKVMKELIENYNLFKEDCLLKSLLNKLDSDRYIFSIKGEEKHKIKADTFDIDYSKDYNNILVDTMLKGIISQIHIDRKNDNEVMRVKKKSDIYFLNYLRHVNDNVGRPVLAVNSDKIINC